MAELELPAGVQSENSVLRDGWKVKLRRNKILGELVPQIPVSNVILQAGKEKDHERQEFHLIVHDIADFIDEPFKMLGLKVGDRVTVDGRALQCHFNGMIFQIVEISMVVAILERSDGALWLGSKYGKDALANGRPA